MSTVSKLSVLLLIVSVLIGTGCSDTPVENERPQTPDFVLKDLDGNRFKLSNTQGNVVVLEFFKPTCSVCQAETEVLNAVNAKYGQDSLVVVSVAVQYGSKEAVEDFKEAYEVNYRLLLDTIGVARAYGVSRVPMMFIIDQEGWIDGNFVGHVSQEQLEAVIKPLLDA